jgi:flagella basal body P-ring formation protein FlgA
MNPARFLFSVAVFAAFTSAPCAQQVEMRQAEAPEQLRLFLQKETSGVAGRVEVSIGNADSRLHLAPCANMQPFIPAGARLWGRTMLGVRCVEGAAWQVFLPAQIKVFGMAPVATRALAPGDRVADVDIRMEEIELTRFAPGAIADPGQLADKQLSRQVAVGQPLLRDQFRPRPVMAQGDTVKLIYSGKGFAVSTSGRALSGATEGQGVRVVTESGRTLSGTARAGHVVDVSI